MIATLALALFRAYASGMDTTAVAGRRLTDAEQVALFRSWLEAARVLGKTPAPPTQLRAARAGRYQRIDPQ